MRAGEDFFNFNNHSPGHKQLANDGFLIDTTVGPINCYAAFSHTDRKAKLPIPVVSARSKTTTA